MENIIREIYKLAEEIANATQNEAAVKYALKIRSLAKDLAKSISMKPKARQEVSPEDAQDSPVIRGANQFYHKNYSNEQLVKMIQETVKKWAKKQAKLLEETKKTKRNKK